MDMWDLYKKAEGELAPFVVFPVMEPVTASRGDLSSGMAMTETYKQLIVLNPKYKWSQEMLREGFSPQEMIDEIERGYRELEEYRREIQAEENEYIQEQAKSYAIGSFSKNELLDEIGERMDER